MSDKMNEMEVDAELDGLTTVQLKDVIKALGNRLDESISDSEEPEAYQQTRIGFVL